MVMTITNFWKLFCYGVKREHYEKSIGIREFLEKISHDCFNNPFSIDTGTPAKNTPILDEVNYGYPVAIFCHIYFCTSLSYHTQDSNISDLTVAIASLSASSFSTYFLHSQPTD